MVTFPSAFAEAVALKQGPWPFPDLARLGPAQSQRGRAKHLLRKYIVLQQRIRSGRCVMRHVESNDNPADFLTKWLSKALFDVAEEYATNSASAVECTSPGLRAWGKERMIMRIAECAATPAARKLGDYKW